MLGLELKILESIDLLNKESINKLYDLLLFYNIVKNKAAVTTKIRPYFQYKNYELLLITVNDDIIGILGLKIEKDVVEIDFIVISENFQRKGIARTIINALPLKYNVKKIDVILTIVCIPVFERLGFIPNNLKIKSKNNIYSYMVNK